MKECWSASPTKRPSFSELVKTVSSLLVGITDYLDLSTSGSANTTVTKTLESAYDHLDEDSSSAVTALTISNISRYDHLNKIEIIITDTSCDEENENKT